MCFEEYDRLEESLNTRRVDGHIYFGPAGADCLKMSRGTRGSQKSFQTENNERMNSLFLHLRAYCVPLKYMRFHSKHLPN